jgi:uncharacterized protein (DUF433 family)
LQPPAVEGPVLAPVAITTTIARARGGFRGSACAVIARVVLAKVVNQTSRPPRISPQVAANVGHNGDMDWREHITVNPAVLHGKACIRGTRIPVAVVLANLADGLSAEEILRSYPTLTAAGIQAALAYAADLAQERTLPLPA